MLAYHLRRLTVGDCVGALWLMVERDGLRCRLRAGLGWEGAEGAVSWGGWAWVMCCRWWCWALTVRDLVGPVATWG